MRTTRAWCWSVRGPVWRGGGAVDHLAITRDCPACRCTGHWAGEGACVLRGRPASSVTSSSSPAALRGQEQLSVNGHGYHLHSDVAGLAILAVAPSSPW